MDEDSQTCNNCGNIIPLKDKYCKKCGTKAVQAQVQDQYSFFAKNILNTDINLLKQKYIIVCDSTNSFSLENMGKALNLLDEYGWELVDFSSNKTAIGLTAAWAILKKKS